MGPRRNAQTVLCLAPCATATGLRLNPCKGDGTHSGRLVFQPGLMLCVCLLLLVSDLLEQQFVVELAAAQGPKA